MTDEPEPALLASAEAGDAEAQNAVGRFYAEQGSEGFSRDRALHWFRRAADQGSPRGKYNVGVIFVRTGQDELALPWLNEAARDGWPAALFALGGLAEEAGNAREAIEMYEGAAERGDAQAQDALGRMMLDRDTPEGYKKSRYWSELASERGIAAADVRLGRIYHEGLGVEQNAARAVRYWLRAAKVGHSGAQLMVGVALEVGGGCEVDLVKSAFFLTLSSAKNEHAKYYLNTRVHDHSNAEMHDEYPPAGSLGIARCEPNVSSPPHLESTRTGPHPIASATALPHATVSALPPRSRVRKVFSASTRSMASTMARPASFSPR